MHEAISTNVRPRLDRPRLWAAAALVFALLAQPGHAWDATGHRIVAQIAWDQLPAPVRAEARALVEIFDLEFVDASVWLDEVRGAGVGLFDRWHYINQPTEDSTGRAPRAHADNLLWAIAESRDALAADEAPKAARALALITLLHVVGDIHQPLHVVSRYDTQHPRGDRGGNSVSLPDPWTNLHRLWDRMGGLVQDPNESRSRVGPKAIRRWAATLVADHPPSTRARSLDPDAWAQESRDFANRVVYPGVQAGRAPDAAYLERARDLAAQRLAIAGYRLAAVIETALTAR